MNALVTVPDEVRAGDRHRLVWTEPGLRGILEAGLDLCVWRRGFSSEFARWTQKVARSTKLEVDERVALTDLPLDRWLGALPRAASLDVLREDVAARAQAYGALLGCTHARVQLHTVDHQHCPRFHVDSVGVRLICTWAGPATEWLAETDLVRSRLGTGATGDAPTRVDGAPRQLERFDVALMKGRAWAGNSKRGLVHRSPPVTREPRLVLTIDAKD